MSFKKTLIAASVAIIASTSAVAADTNPVRDNNEQEFNVSTMDSIEREKLRLKQLIELRELQAKIDEIENPTIVEDNSDELKTQLESSQVTIENLASENYTLKIQLDNLTKRISRFEDPTSLDAIEHHIFVTRTYSSKGNKKATVLYLNSFKDLVVGEEIAKGVVIRKIDDGGITIAKPDGSEHKVRTTTRRRAIIESTRLTTSDDAMRPAGPEIGLDGEIVPSI